jgi:hypothetical protein
MALQDAPMELQEGIVEFWPPEERENAANISWLESGWRWDAENNTVTDSAPCGTPIGTVGGVQVFSEHSIGYFQINACNFPKWNPCHLFNARQNCGTAHALWEQAGGKWTPWFLSAKALGLI